MRRARLGGASAMLLAALLQVGPAFGLDSGDAQRQAETAIQQIESDVVRGAAANRPRTMSATPAERVAAGDMLLRTKDYDRAIAELSKVLELHRQGQIPEAAFADAHIRSAAASTLIARRPWAATARS